MAELYKRHNIFTAVYVFGEVDPADQIRSKPSLYGQQNRIFQGVQSEPLLIRVIL